MNDQDVINLQDIAGMMRWWAERALDATVSRELADGARRLEELAGNWREQRNP